MRLKKSWLVVPTAAALMFGLAGCGAGGSAGAEANGEAPIESIVTASLFDSVYGHFNPFRSSGQASADGTILTMLYGQLVQMNAEGEIEPDIALSFEPNDDFTVWSLKLRDGLLFSDGTPLDAEAVKWNFDFNSNPENGTYHVLSMLGTTSTVIDATTLEVAPAKPNANFDKLIASGIGMMVSPTAYEADPDGFGLAPVGAGPYVLDSWSKDTEVVFSANPEYYEADQNNVAEVVVKVIRDPSQQLNMLASDEIDVARGISGALLTQAEQQGFEGTSRTLSGQGSGYVFNTRQAPFDDARAREAVALAVDLDALAQVASGSEAAVSYFAEESPFFNGAVRPETNEAEQAQALFDELAAEGKPVSFKLVAIDTGASASVEALQSQLLAYDNVSVEIDLQNVQTYAATVNQTFDFGMMQFGTTFVDPEPRYYDSFYTGGNQNKFGFSNDEVDSLLEAARLTRDTAERKKSYDKVQDIVAQEVLQLKLEDSRTVWVHDADLDVVLGGDGVMLYQHTTRG